jgi:hypothetical protein
MDMGLSDQEFGQLTLKQFDLLSGRLEASREHDYLCAGIVSSTIANVNRDPDKHKPWVPSDFYRTSYVAPSAPSARMSVDEFMSHMNSTLKIEAD